MKTRASFLAAGTLLGALTSGFSQPVITTQPLWQTNAVGSTAKFSVVATGVPPLFYQWRFNSGDRAGATNATLALTNAQTTNQGNYSVVVTESGGLSVTSAVARLYVFLPPMVTTDPVSRTVGRCGNVSFTVTASGTPPLRYQWRLNE